MERVQIRASSLNYQ
ncbi:hypothetical protein FOXB_16887 [Fusarium oxysporum f. sp. conglutinans Fo5176]|uniref:Uncharacterized protein n=1 Tax=Fusarium oxysporum (strain Fo5176) TaxID=660025 RepID=F9GE03_FUSOF|nr:hypothetical protein FOXB_16887 [Fusarium oxysporum f. sp. conglutinans Fo5176]